MIDLDQPATYGELDRSDMLARVVEMEERIEAFAPGFRSTAIIPSSAGW